MLKTPLKAEAYFDSTNPEECFLNLEISIPAFSI
jgi:hypothetical protein